MNENNIYEMDSEICLKIGKSLINEPLNIIFNYETNNSKTYKEYKEEYINKLYIQIDKLKKEKEEKEYEYRLKLDIHKKTMDKITYLNKKIGFKNPNIKHHSNSTINFISLHVKHLKETLKDTIEENIENSKKIYELEKEMECIDFSILKTNEYITYNLK